ncbi:MAG TPA: MOSC domain-containing protein [Dictyobacter sp.]|jgi:MOSC domain-containing protein YiiM|nr:MOSC domain-containing protein [Dictyobacter sp.]
MHVVSVNVGQPREVVWHGKTVQTSIFKSPVEGRSAVRACQVEGDRQSDTINHGGRYQSIYVYSVEHYRYWRPMLAGVDLHWGHFGENFTIEGLPDSEVHIGDRFRIGTAEVVVTRPRNPCYKLGIRFEREDMTKLFLQSGRLGYYFGIEQEGEVAAGDRVELLERASQNMTVAEVSHLFYDASDLAAVQRASETSALAPSVREYFQRKLEKRTVNN